MRLAKTSLHSQWESEWPLSLRFRVACAGTAVEGIQSESSLNGIGQRGSYCRDLAYMATPPTGEQIFNHCVVSDHLADGTLCQWYLCPITNAVKIPPSISWREAACIQPLAVAIHATSRARVSAHQNIAVFGSGALGLLCMAVAKALGARTTVAVDISRSRLDFAREYAATHAHLARTRHPKVSAESFAKEESSIIVGETGVEGFDVVIEASGAEQSMHTGLELLRPGGTCE